MSTRRLWIWGHDKKRSFSEIKEELTKSTVLALYDPQAETKVSADASSFGLGAVLLQANGQTWRPVAMRRGRSPKLKNGIPRLRRRPSPQHGRV